ncbi:MAG TPA: GNAT family N-acetyltransferase [Egibacteraceae bacterium]|nr:GNAT family N-acetyltransferase [Egibacteraceae bacterium]
MALVRESTPDDASTLGAVHVRAWQVAYRKLMPDSYLDQLSAAERAEMWRDRLKRAPRPKVGRFVAENDGKRLAGFIMVGPAGGEEHSAHGEVYALNVDPDHWGRGIGQALLDAGTRHLGGAGFDEAVLWLHPRNERAQEVLRGSGLAVRGRAAA